MGLRPGIRAQRRQTGREDQLWSSPTASIDDYPVVLVDAAAPVNSRIDRRGNNGDRGRAEHSGNRDTQWNSTNTREVYHCAEGPSLFSVGYQHEFSSEIVVWHLQQYRRQRSVSSNKNGTQHFNRISKTFKTRQSGSSVEQLETLTADTPLCGSPAVLFMW